MPNAANDDRDGDTSPRDPEDPGPSAHPGGLLTWELEARAMDADELARLLSVSVERVRGVLAEEQPVTAELAARIGEVLDVPARMLLSLQARYDLARAR